MHAIGYRLQATGWRHGVSVNFFLLFIQFHYFSLGPLGYMGISSGIKRVKRLGFRNMCFYIRILGPFNLYMEFKCKFDSFPNT